MLKVYIDTNIFDYVVLRHETFGSACKEILDDISIFLDAHCSFLVPIEMLGSLSEISPEIAFKALEGFFSFKIKLIDVADKSLIDAGKICQKTKIDGYDAVHVASMKKVKVKTIMTENYKDFKKVKGLEIVRPLDYRAWKRKFV